MIRFFHHPAKPHLQPLEWRDPPPEWIEKAIADGWKEIDEVSFRLRMGEWRLRQRRRRATRRRDDTPPPAA